MIFSEKPVTAFPDHAWGRLSGHMLRGHPFGRAHTNWQGDGPVRSASVRGGAADAAGEERMSMSAINRLRQKKFFVQARPRGPLSPPAGGRVKAAVPEPSFSMSPNIFPVFGLTRCTRVQAVQVMDSKVSV